MPQDVEDLEVLTMAKATQARRRFKLSLRQLCLQQVARHEQLFVLNPGQAALLAQLPSELKTDVLQELSRMVGYEHRYPGGKQRMELVKNLIHGKLENFNFAVCNRHRKSAVLPIWQCLVDKARDSLKSVTDLGCETRSAEYSMANVLPFIAQIPLLQVFKVVSWCFVKSELRQLVTAAPNLKVLHINVHSFKRSDINELHQLKALVELDMMSASRSDVNLAKAMKALLEQMPWLKINCVRSDVQMPEEKMEVPVHLESKQVLKRPLELEHISLASHQKIKKKNKNLLSNVNHVMVSEMGGEDDPEDGALNYTRIFGPICTLHLRYFCVNIVLPLVRVNGASITSLVLDCLDPDFKSGTEQLDVFELLALCPQLNIFEVHGPVETKKYSAQTDIPEGAVLPLKKLKLIGVSVRGTLFLKWILRAPLLQEVHLWCTAWRKMALSKATDALKNGEIQLSSLQNFEFSLVQRHGFSCHEASFSFVASVLSLCPNLKQVNIDLDREELNERLKAIVNVVNRS